MKTIEKCGAQGDVIFRRVDKIPADVVEQKRAKGQPVIATHSETGHHHVIHAERVRLFGAESSLVAYLQISEPYADVEHLRPYDTHETVRLGEGCWEIRRQREFVPEGWRRVAD
jgi:hypothetical protein